MLRSNKKIGGCICIRRVSSSNGFKFRQELTAVQLKMYVTPPLTDASGPQFFKFDKVFFTVIVMVENIFDGYGDGDGEENIDRRLR